MGKKSLEPPSLSLVGTAPPITQREQRLQLSHDLLRILLLQKALGMNLSGPAPPIQVSPFPSTSTEELPPCMGSVWDCLARAECEWIPESQGPRAQRRNIPKTET